MKYICESYNSIDSLLRTIAGRKYNKVFSSMHSSVTGNEKFTGTASYEAAEKLIREGWQEPLRSLKAADKELKVKANVTTNRSRPRNSVVGYAPCVPAAILGLPESMIATERVPSKVKAVTIVYSASSSASVKTEQFLKAGAAVLQIVNNLELKGYRVRLLSEFYAGQESEERFVARVLLKDWRQPLDLKKICFPIAHASMLRRIGFRCIETNPEIKESDWKWGYGSPLAVKMSYEALVADYKRNGLLSDNEYYINREMVEAERFDLDRVMKKAGMNL